MNCDSKGDAYQALVLIETSGNQHYLYKTNKLKENVGASQITRMVGQWAHDAAPDQQGVVLATSGKALIQVPTRQDGIALVRSVTRRALREAPGLQVTGAVVDLGDDPADALDKVHKRFNANRDAMGLIRAPVLPWTQPCATSGSPATGWESTGDQRHALSAESIAKQQAARDWSRYIESRLKFQGADLGGQQFFIAHDIDRLQRFFDDTQWLGVVHADGNGLGQIFLDLATHLGNLPNSGKPKPRVFEAMKAISDELQGATERAFYAACEHIHWLGASRAYQAPLRRHGAKCIYVPVIPLVLAGDDLTVLVEGEYALPFAKTFLRAFEEETAKCETIARVAKVALGAPRLSAAAGVALVKHHFPFHLAYGLAEQLLKSAKKVKRQIPATTSAADLPAPFPASALDFHVLFDASYTDLESIRSQRMTTLAPVTCDKTNSQRVKQRLYGGPYVVTPLDQLDETSEVGRTWATAHHFDHLATRFAAFNAEDPITGRARLPSSQMHALRQAVAQGKAYGDARLRDLRWLDTNGLKDLIETADSLFTQRDGEWSTRFIDAINGAGFWPDPDHATTGSSATTQEDDHE